MSKSQKLVPGQEIYFNSLFPKFFNHLRDNNNKDWFNNNKQLYCESVDEPFKKFIGDLILVINKMDPSISITANGAIFRLNRDMRFSKDMPPYKLYKSALISSGSTRSKEVPSFYLELGAEKVKIGGGCYKVSASNFKKIKLHINKLFLTEEFRDKYEDIELNEVNKSITYEAFLNPQIMFGNTLLPLVLEYWKASQAVNFFLSNLLSKRN